MSTLVSFRNVALGLVLAASVTAIIPLQAVVPDSTSAINTDAKGLALQGYDPVAYFKAGKPMKGSPRFSYKYQNVTYRFANAGDLRAFKANPAAYTPQFGGFCAMGVALEKKLDGDPMVWRIVDGKLYVNVNKDVQGAWLRDVPGNLEKANENWPKIQASTPASLG